MLRRPKARRYASLAAPLLMLYACNSHGLDDFPEYKEFRSFVETHYDSLNKADGLLLENREITNIWEIAGELRFSNYDGEIKKYLDVSNAEEFRAVLPQHGNMLYLSTDQFFLFGPGVMSDCHGYTCEVSAAKLRSETTELQCTPELVRKPGTCHMPLYKEWQIRYSVFDLDA